jgi:hypothetical protein
MIERVMRRLGYQKIRPLPDSYLLIRGCKVTIGSGQSIDEVVVGVGGGIEYESGHDSLCDLEACERARHHLRNTQSDLSTPEHG